MANGFGSAVDLACDRGCPVRLKVAVSGVRLQWTLQCPELGCESLLGSGWVAGEQFWAVKALQLELAPVRGSGRRVRGRLPRRGRDGTATTAGRVMGDTVRPT